MPLSDIRAPLDRKDHHWFRLSSQSFNKWQKVSNATLFVPWKGLKTNDGSSSQFPAPRGTWERREGYRRWIVLLWFGGRWRYHDGSMERHHHWARTRTRSLPPLLHLKLTLLKSTDCTRKPNLQLKDYLWRELSRFTTSCAISLPSQFAIREPSGWESRSEQGQCTCDVDEGQQYRNRVSWLTKVGFTILSLSLLNHDVDLVYTEKWHPSTIVNYPNLPKAVCFR